MARRIKLYVNTGFAGCTHEDFEPLPPGWDDMSEEKKQEWLDEAAIHYRNERIDDFGAYVVDDKDDE